VKTDGQYLFSAIKAVFFVQFVTVAFFQFAATAECVVVFVGKESFRSLIVFQFNVPLTAEVKTSEKYIACGRCEIVDLVRPYTMAYIDTQKK
jgi:hypothetical protein